jgi:hypothetical protein
MMKNEFSEMYHYQLFNLPWEMTPRWIDMPPPHMLHTVVVEYRFRGKTHSLRGPAFKVRVGEREGEALGYALFGTLYHSYDEWLRARDRLRWMVLRMELKYRIRKSLRRNEKTIQAYYSLEGKGGQRHVASIHALEGHRDCTSQKGE